MGASQNRRGHLRQLASAVAATAVASRSWALEPTRASSKLGLVMYDCRIRRDWLASRQPGHDLFEPLTFLKHCREIGAGGAQVALGVLEPEPIDRLRDFAAAGGLFVEAIVRPPRDDSDVDRFEAEIRTAKAVGVRAARTVIMPGRRYEQFDSLEAFRAAAERGKRMLQRAVPVVERHRVPLAVENHKDQRVDERVRLLEEIDSEYVGVCLDTGNSFALLDDPYGALDALAPYAFSVHLKDQALQLNDDGFWLGDIPLGEGSFDLPRMVEIIRRAKPEVNFSLELITRDPLRVPCLAERYWRTMPEVPGADLARTLRFVRDHAVAELQQVSSRSQEQRVALEDENVARSLAYAQRQLGL